jgi:hypothetical protein
MKQMASRALIATCFTLVFGPEDGGDMFFKTPSYIPEDRTLHKHCCENLRFYIQISCLLGLDAGTSSFNWAQQSRFFTSGWRQSLASKTSSRVKIGMMNNVQSS